MNFFEPLIPAGAVMLGTCLYWHVAYPDAVTDSLMFRDLRTREGRRICAIAWVVHLGAAMTLVWTAWRLAQ